MLISVIIPAYNAERTIVDTLDSVEAQAAWAQSTDDGRRMTDDGVRCEVIVVDDASTDDTAAAVRKWAEKKYGGVGVSVCGSTEREEQGAEGEKSIGVTECPGIGVGVAEEDVQRKEHEDSPVTPIHPHTHTPILIITLPRNSGPAAARNRGIAEAKGEWIAFLDADDRWLPEKLTIQIAMARQQPDVAMWCGGVIARGKDEGGNLKPEVSREKAQEAQQEDSLSSSGLKSHPSSLRKLHLEEFACGNPVATSTVLIRKAALDAVGGFDEQFRGPEDYDLWMRLAARFPVALIEVSLARYRQRAGSLSMDDRSFLPQVLRVVDKAFDEEGSLVQYQSLRGTALSNQYWNASWMAFNRGDRVTAIRYWLKAYRLNRKADLPLDRQWLRLLTRYLWRRS